ncbi:MAG: repressor LexA [Anaerolineaceae bacterium 4572_32.1]|nr:MAG: repressor LexA [Anaerolineaceae bacterium 4572_32.1]
MALSTRQKHILAFIREFIIDNGYPPSIREIGEAADISSTSVVNYNLKALEKKGLIARDRTVSRGIRLPDLIPRLPDISAGLMRIPLLGRIAAGEPIPVPDTDFSLFDGETIELAQGIFPDQEGMYALQVRGDSMIDALVNDGDIVVMKHQQHANNGDMVAAWIKDKEETTLKHFYLENDTVRLQPANPRMQPIFIPAVNVEIQGKVVMVIRQL